jgi:hypothetical protein
LSSQAIAVLHALPRSPSNPHVFAGRSRDGHISHPAGTWNAVSGAAGLHLTAYSMRRTFTNAALKLGIEMWKVELLTSHVPTTTTLLHYTDTADLRGTCAFDIQRLGDWIEAEAVIAISRPSLVARSLSAGSRAVEYAVITADPSGQRNAA